MSGGQQPLVTPLPPLSGQEGWRHGGGPRAETRAWGGFTLGAEISESPPPRRGSCVCGREGSGAQAVSIVDLGQTCGAGPFSGG